MQPGFDLSHVVIPDLIRDPLVRRWFEWTLGQAWGDEMGWQQKGLSYIISRA